MENTYTIAVCGFSPRDFQAVLPALSPSLREKIHIVPLTTGLFENPLQETLDLALKGEIGSGTPLSLNQKFVLMDVPRGEAGEVMSAFKRIENPTGVVIIYALPTPKAKSWKVSYYLDHLQEEDRQMKDPKGLGVENDEDMQKL